MAYTWKNCGYFLFAACFFTVSCFCAASFAATSISIGDIQQSGSNNRISIGGSTINSSGLVEGSGKRVRLSQSKDKFSEIDINLAADIEYQPASRYELVLEGDDNILPLLSTEVSEGRLRISSKANYVTENKISITVFAPFLSRFESRGSSDIQFTDLQSPSLELRMTGSGNLQAKGRVTDLSVKLSGSGDLNMRGLKSEQATLELKGSGNVSLYASRQFTGRITGSGDVRVFGNPGNVTKKVTGSGEFVFK